MDCVFTHIRIPKSFALNRHLYYINKKEGVDACLTLRKWREATV